jgi:hypothetical protein
VERHGRSRRVELCEEPDRQLVQDVFEILEHERVPVWRLTRVLTPRWEPVPRMRQRRLAGSARCADMRTSSRTASRFTHPCLDAGARVLSARARLIDWAMKQRASRRGRGRGLTRACPRRRAVPRAAEFGGGFLIEGEVLGRDVCERVRARLCDLHAAHRGADDEDGEKEEGGRGRERGLHAAAATSAGSLVTIGCSPRLRARAGEAVVAHNEEAVTARAGEKVALLAVGEAEGVGEAAVSLPCAAL